jgi:acyl transferase domain-containing protein/acyl carrier protein
VGNDSTALVDPAEQPGQERPCHLLTLSAKSEAALPALAQRYLRHLQEQPGIAVGDFCYTAAVGRNHLSQRMALVAADRTDLQNKLAAVVQGQPATGIQRGAVTSTRPRLAFLFTGQGAQYGAMGHELYTSSPTFRAALDRCEALYQEYSGESLLAVLFEGAPPDGQRRTAVHERASGLFGRSALDETTYTQPALFALEYALAALWRSWGVQPDYLLGHSVGEVAAACVAGVFSLEDGMKLIAARGRLMGALPQEGAMMAVTATVDAVEQAIAPYADRVAIAAINGPTSVVISGHQDAVNTVAALVAGQSGTDVGSSLQNSQSTIQKLRVSHAFHSPLMEAMLDDFQRVAQEIAYHAPKLPVVSNITGKLAGDEIATPAYWVRHVREAVRFADGIATLAGQGIDLYLEIGPKPTLLGMAQPILESRLGICGPEQPATAGEIPKPHVSKPLLLASLRPAQSDWQQMLETLAAFYVRGVALDWHGFAQDDVRQKIRLPVYPFVRQRFWPTAAGSQPEAAETTPGFANCFATHTIEQLTDLITERGQLTATDRPTVAKVLTILDHEERNRQMAAQIDALLYEITWEAQSKPLSLFPPATPGRWLLLRDEEGIGAALAAALQAVGEVVTTLSAESMLADVLPSWLAHTAEAPPMRGILHLWGVQGSHTATLNGSTLMADQERTLGSLLQVVQALATASDRGPLPRLWVITQGAQQLSPTEVVAVAQTPLWGLGHVIALEHPRFWGGLIDLDQATAPQRLLAEFFHTPPDGETQVAYRQGTRYVARLSRAAQPAPAQAPLPIHADATYLITGGLGALGLLIADWLAVQGAGHLILTGRRGITTTAQAEAVQQLTARGSTVQIAQVDVADDAAMHALFAQIAAATVPLKGIFHTAGVLDDAILLNQRWARFAPVLAPKVTGGWLLHQLTQELDLDFLVFFSSATALLGNWGQGNYAAANAFLDGLARYRRQQGLPGLSINWGAWAEVGMAARTAAETLSADNMIQPQVGIAALARLLNQHVSGPHGYGTAQIAVVAVDWQHFAPSQQPFLANFVPQSSVSATPASSLRTALAARPKSEQLDVLRSHVQQVVGTVLGMAESPDPATGFAELGMDSLMALELRRRLESDLNCTLPTTIAFEYPTADELAAYLLQDVVAPPLPPPPSPRTSGQSDGTEDKPSTAPESTAIAVVSMACRFPGADTPEAFWQLLVTGTDMVQAMPASRWDVEAFYDPQRPTPGKMYTRAGAFVDGVEEFDPLFFGISPREATHMDPHHRLLLEMSWEALERAGLAPSSLVDSQTGVFVGIGESDYPLVVQGINAGETDPYAVTSSGHSIAAGRLAYTLGLQGPTLAVDTACSSSLVALHLACQSLHNGECDLALAGGVNLMLTPFTHIALSQLQALSPDGRCKTFDAAADGYGRGEGGAMVLLKRLSDAQRDGTPILAVVKGSAVNHDGHSSGLTVPNKRAQEKLLRQALAAAQVTPEQVSYVEAHGTGTALGDPIEIRALDAVFGTAREQPLWVGSVKTNIGHLEAAAGIAGFLKTVLALQHGQLPPHLHLHTPSPYIEWDKIAIQVPTTLQLWPAPQIAGISAFGLSGTNAHFIVAAPPAPPPAEPQTQKRMHHLLTLSAKNAAALPALAQRYLSCLQQQPELAVENLCYTAAVGRNHFHQRMALVATDHTDLQHKLAALAKSQPAPGAQQGAATSPRPRLAFLFTGQGAQYEAMGRDLYTSSPTFRTTLDRCEALYQEYTGASLLAVLYAETPTEHGRSALDETTYTQPALFALEYALATLWRSWGVHPDYLLGHSVGEVAAACVAGVFSLEDGMKLIAARSRLMGALPQKGTMIAVTAAVDAVNQAIAPYADQVAVAAINGPTSIVLSGHQDAVYTVAALLTAHTDTDSTLQNLRVSHAFHSPLMDAMLDDFHQVAQRIAYHAPQIPLVSNITGTLAGAEIATPAYWVRHVRETVRFADGIATLAAQNVDLYLEIGPKPTLLGMAQPVLESACQSFSPEQPAPAGELQQPKPHKPLLLPSLRPTQPDWQQMLAALGSLYVQGVAIDWAGFDQDYVRQNVALPTYPFQRQHCWPTRKEEQTVEASTGFAEWWATRDITTFTDRIIARLAATNSHTALSVERTLIAQVLSALEAEQHAQQTTAQVEALLYEVAWERRPKPAILQPLLTPGYWLILADGRGVGTAFATALEELGEMVEQLSSGTEPAQLQIALANVGKTDRPLRGILHCWGLDPGASDTPDAHMACQFRNLGSLLQIVQTLATDSSKSKILPRLWIITQGAQPLTATEPVALTQTPLWGLGRVIALEHGELWGGLLDIDAATAPKTALAEILSLHSDGETQVAYRQETRHVARLVRRRQRRQGPTPVAIHPDATYLVTGGLGALGLRVADWLAAQGARHLLLTGRRGITTAEQQETLDRLITDGVTVQVVQVDVTDESAMRALFAQLAGSAFPVKGVFHTAGVLDDAILLNQRWERFAPVLASKVAGAWLLHQLTQDLPLDFMIFFSSAAALLGSMGQGNYAAANAFLDGLAHYRQRQGLPALSMNWGAWAEVGMAARTVQSALTSEHRISPELGMMTVAHLLADTGQVGVLPIDWTALTQSSYQPFLANFIPPPAPSAQATLVATLAGLPANQRLAHLRAHVQQAVATILGMNELPACDSGFADLGMDSLMALELRRRLESDLGSSLPTTLAFEYPTVDELNSYLLNEVLTLATPAITQQPGISGVAEQPQTYEPIAVVSMACRFPGADTPEAFWQLLCEGMDMVRTMPAARWDVDAFYDSQRPTPGKMYTREGAFVDGVEEFDPLFFGISPREAIGMDPHHRLLLEVSWEALERAGLAPGSLVDSQTGVFVGIGESDYPLVLQGASGGGTDPYAVTNSGHSIAAGRLAYTLGLQGPTLAVDTACSSSLVAVHLACQSLRNGECDLALAGGVNLMLTPFSHIALSQMQALSPDGRCKTFDAAADGYGRGEGGAVVLLKRLGDAQRDGDAVLAVVKGSAVNHDGHSSGLTVPNKRAQEKLLRQALATAHVTPEQVSYIEAHGTGTALGDPIEIRALGAVFGAVRERPLWVGSVKTNIGHLEAAAGIAGFLKTVLAVQHGQLPPHLHLHTPSPYIEWDEVALQVPTTLEFWPEPRIAGISAFGLSGTNAHCIIAAPPAAGREGSGLVGNDSTALVDPAEQPGQERPCHLLTLSAKSEAALPALAQRYLRHLQEQPGIAVGDFCYTAAVGRNHLSQRMALVAADRTDLQNKLAAVVQGQPATGIQRGAVTSTRPRLAFLFTGQGAQYGAMGHELYTSSPTFRAALDRCEALYQEYSGESLLAVLFEGAPPDGQRRTAVHERASGLFGRSALDETTYTQPALFALEYALAALWRSWGVQPDYLLGHSVGEVAAACVAGVFSLEDGMKLIAARGRLMGALPQEGAMMAVTATVDAVEQAIAPYADRVAIAAINGPTSVVISGHQDAVNTVAALVAGQSGTDVGSSLQNSQSTIQKLRVSHAFHSPLMEAMLDDFQRVAQEIAYHAPKLPVVSNITGKLAGDEIATPAYWVRHVREAVRFADGIATLAGQGIDLYLEIGPKPTLLGMAQPILESRLGICGPEQPATAGEIPKPHVSKPLLLASLRPAQSDWQQMLETLAAFYVRGVALDWHGFAQDDVRQKIRLPTYPFQRQRYWVESHPTSGWDRTQKNTLRPLIEKMIAAPSLRATLFETALSVRAFPFLADHRVYNLVVAPGACHLAMVLSAAELAYPSRPRVDQGYELKMVVFPQPLTLTETEICTTQVIFTPAHATASGTQANFQLLSLNGTPDEADFQQRTHAAGSVGTIQTGEAATSAMSLHKLQERCIIILPVADATAENKTEHVTEAKETPIAFGPAFRWIEEIRHAPLDLGGDVRPAIELLARLRRPAAVPSLAGYLVHPGLLDACFQVVGWGHQLAAQNTDLHLPFALELLQIYPMHPEESSDSWWCHVTQRGATLWDIQLFDSTGQRLIFIAGYEIRAAPQSAIPSSAVRTDWLYTLDWEIKPLPNEQAAASDFDSWVLWGNAAPLCRTLVHSLGASGTPLFWVQNEAGSHTGSSEALQQWVVDPTDAAAIRAVVAKITSKHRRVGFIYLGVIDETVADAAVPATALALSSGLLQLVQALSTVQTAVRLWIVTQGVQPIAQQRQTRQIFAAAGTLWGLGRTIAQEQPPLQTVCIDLDQSDSPATQAALLSAEIRRGVGETQIVYQQQRRYVARLDHWQGMAAPAVSSIQQPMRLHLREYGSLDNLRFAPMVRQTPAAGEVEVAVRAVGLNFRDVLNTLGMLQEYYATVLGIHRAEEVALGFECAGIIATVGEEVTAWAVGDRVMGIVNGAFASSVTVPATALAKIPDRFTFAEAATIPLAFLTAWYGLKELAQLQAGERILIHAAAGGVGQAALQIAQASGAEVWATASPAKWEFLRSQGVDRLLNSRTLDFARQIAQQTAGAGVDVIVNSLKGDFVEQSFAVLANQGRFVEIGKLGIWTPTEAEQRRPDAAYHPFDLGEVLAKEPALYPRMWAALLEHFADGAFRPLPHKIFPVRQVVDAFRFMQQAKQIGKVVVSWEEAPRTEIQAAASYLITGGVGDLGLQMAQQLAAEGAKHLILTGRRAVVPETAQPTLAGLEKAGVAVHVVQADVAEQADVMRVLAICNEIAPLRGIVHAAGVLDDGLLAQQSVERWTRVLRPKVDGAWHLHRLTQAGEMAGALDFFVCFSSASSMLGAVGQSNYAAANAFMDTLMQQRAAAGLPGLSINWGPWAEIGMAARLATHHQKRLMTAGIGSISPRQGVQLFSALLANAAYGGQVGVLPIRWGSTAASTSFLERLIRPISAAPSPQSQVMSGWLAELEKASAQECQRLFMAYLQEAVTKILRLPAPPQPQQGLVDIGMDSLMAVELRSHVGNTFQLSLAMTAFIDSTIEQLAIMLAEQWLLARLQADHTSPNSGTTTDTLTRQPEAQPKESDLQDEVLEEFVL